MGQTSAYRFPYPEATDVVQVSADMNNLATAIDTRLLFDSSRARPSVVAAEAIDATQYVSQIVNTTAITQFFSVPLVGGVAGNVFILTYRGSILNNTGASRDATVYIKIGAGTVFTSAIGAIANSNTMRSMEGEIRLHVESNTSAILTTSFTGGSTALVNMNSGVSFYQQNVNTALVNMSTNPNLTMEIAPNLANENYFFRLHNYRLMKLGTT